MKSELAKELDAIEKQLKNLGFKDVEIEFNHQKEELLGIDKLHIKVKANKDL